VGKDVLPHPYPRILFIPRCPSVKGNVPFVTTTEYAGTNVQTPQPGPAGLVTLLRIFYLSPRLERWESKEEWENG
jgi:hypothetical protein